MLPARPDDDFLAANEEAVIRNQAASSTAAAAAAASMMDDDEAIDSATQSPLPQTQHSTLSSPHVGPVSCVRWSSTGEYVLSGGQDRTVNLWSPLKSKHIKTYAGHHGREVLGLALSPLSDRFVSCGGDRAIYLMDVSSGECIRRLRAHESAVNAVAFNADAGLIASGGYDKSLRLWDARSHSRDPIQSMIDAKDSVTGVLIREHSVYASSMDGCVRRYDVRMASRTTDHIATAVSALALSHDGNCLLISCLDSSYRLMDLASGELLNEYAGATATDYRMECCFDNSDGYVVGGSETGEIFIWDLVEAKVRHKYLGHTGAVSCVQWNPKSKSFVSAGVDGTIRMWNPIRAILSLSSFLSPAPPQHRPSLPRMSQPRSHSKADAKRLRFNDTSVASPATDTEDRSVRQRTDAISSASAAAPHFSFMRLAVVERQLIMQGLDIEELARLASTCRQMRGEALHKEAGKFIPLPRPDSRLSVQYRIDLFQSAHGSSFFRMHAPVCLSFYRPLCRLSEQELIFKASQFARITELRSVPDDWTEALVLQLLAQPWIQSVTHVYQQLSAEWLSSSFVQRALFALPQLSTIRLDIDKYKLQECAMKMAAKLHSAHVFIRPQRAEDILALRVLPALSSLTLVSTLMPNDHVNSILGPLVWCLPRSLTSLTLESFSLDPVSTPRSLLKAMFLRLPKLQVLDIAFGMEIAPVLQGMLDAGVSALPDLRHVQFNTSVDDDPHLMRRFLHNIRIGVPQSRHLESRAHTSSGREWMSICGTTNRLRPIPQMTSRRVRSRQTSIHSQPSSSLNRATGRCHRSLPPCHL